MWSLPVTAHPVVRDAAHGSAVPDSPLTITNTILRPAAQSTRTNPRTAGFFISTPSSSSTLEQTGRVFGRASVGVSSVAASRTIEKSTPTNPSNTLEQNSRELFSSFQTAWSCRAGWRVEQQNADRGHETVEPHSAAGVSAESASSLPSPLSQQYAVSVCGVVDSSRKSYSSLLDVANARWSA